MRDPEEADAAAADSVRVSRAVEVSELTDADAKAAVEAALTHGGRRGLRVDVVFVDDATLQGMHEEFLDDPTVTDVMAFDYTQTDGEADPQAEVYVSADRARAVALQRGEDVHHELLLYLVHVSLHLCGMDDQEEVSRKEMREAERIVLSNL